MLRLDAQVLLHHWGVVGRILWIVGGVLNHFLSSQRCRALSQS
jgi:hypothetical protein